MLRIKSFPVLKKNDKFSILGMYNMALAGQKTLCFLARPENNVKSEQTYFSYSLDYLKAFILQTFRRNSLGGFTETASKNVVNLKILL